MKSVPNKKYTVKTKSTAGFRGSQWNVFVKYNGFGSIVNAVLDQLERPNYIWRSRIYDEICKNEQITREYSDRTIRHMISVCMGDPGLTGYIRDGGKNIRNPRFKKAGDE